MRSARRIPLSVAVAGAGAAAYALFESQWVEWKEVDIAIEGLPPELDGLRILHLSDFHLGTVSFNARTLDKAVALAGSRGQTPGHDAKGQFDLVAVTGDLLSRRRGEPVLRRALAKLRARHGVFAVLGNHDIAQTRDPFADARPVTDAELADTVLLVDDARSFEVEGRRVQVVGADPHGFAHARSQLHEFADPHADVRILLCHFPDVVRRLPPGVFHLVLAGHLHGGQICLPTPWGKLRLEHLRAAHWEGLYRTPAGMLYVSRGLGTSFVPFRFLARPEVTALTLRGN